MNTKYTVGLAASAVAVLATSILSVFVHPLIGIALGLATVTFSRKEVD